MRHVAIDNLPDLLFVYGTLQPGDERWRFLAPFVVDEGVPDRVHGTLFDTGLGYPAARFGSTRSVIVGRCYRLRSDRLAQAWAELDAVESAVVGSFHRIAVTTLSGRTAQAYEYGLGDGEGVTLTTIVSGQWATRNGTTTPDGPE